MKTTATSTTYSNIDSTATADTERWLKAGDKLVNQEKKIAAARHKVIEAAFNELRAGVDSLQWNTIADTHGLSEAEARQVIEQLDCWLDCIRETEDL